MDKLKTDYINHYESPLGRIILTSDGSSLTGLRFARDAAVDEADLPVFKETAAWLDIYFSGREPDFLPPMRLETTEFRKAVCKIMLTIPYGKTMTYGEIAGMIAADRGMAKMSAQAVGGAVGHNPISIIIPCHRVIGADGSMVGYGGGIDRKLKLLSLEKAGMEL